LVSFVFSLLRLELGREVEKVGNQAIKLEFIMIAPGVGSWKEGALVCPVSWLCVLALLALSATTTRLL